MDQNTSTTMQIYIYISQLYELISSEINIFFRRQLYEVVGTFESRLN